MSRNAGFEKSEATVRDSDITLDHYFRYRLPGLSAVIDRQEMSKAERHSCYHYNYDRCPFHPVSHHQLQAYSREEESAPVRSIFRLKVTILSPDGCASATPLQAPPFSSLNFHTRLAAWLFVVFCSTQ